MPDDRRGDGRPTSMGLVRSSETRWECFLSSPDTGDRQARSMPGRTHGRPTQEPAKSKAVSWFLSCRGHHVPAPLWEGCRATIQTLLSRLAVPAGGRWSFLAVVLLALVLLAGLWVWGFFSVPEPVFFSRCGVLGLWFPASEATSLQASWLCASRRIRWLAFAGPPRQ